MVMEPGGRADKEGNRYEVKCILCKLIRIIGERILGVITEPLGDEESGTDYVIISNGMIVIGDGKRIPGTDDYIYDISKVIMVIEVKKALYSKELSDGYDNLRSVINISETPKSLKMNLIDDAFSLLVGRPAPRYENVDLLQIREQMLFHTLVVEAMLPLRVIFGFEGFKTEISLRQKFYEYLKEKCTECDGEMTLEEAVSKLNSEEYGDPPETKYGYGANSLPNLIVAGDNSIVKTNGMPYSIVFDEIDEYCWMASYRRDPLILFMELLWTRLTYYYDISSDVFGEGVRLEGLAPLISATGTKTGWIYRPIVYSKKDIEILDKNDKEWEPAILDENEFVLMNMLCGEQEINVKELDIYFPGKRDEIISHLNGKRLIYVDKENIIRLLTKQCNCAIVPGYGYVAGDNNDGRLMHWVKEKMKEIKGK